MAGIGRLLIVVQFGVWPPYFYIPIIALRASPLAKDDVCLLPLGVGYERSYNLLLHGHLIISLLRFNAVRAACSRLGQARIVLLAYSS